MKIKKILLFLIPLLFLLPKNTNAMALTKVELMDGNYKVLRTLDSTQIDNLTFATFPSTSVRRMRIYFSGLKVTAGYNYTAMIYFQARNSLILPDTISGIYPYVAGVYQNDCSFTFYKKGSTSGSLAGITYFDTEYEAYSNFNAKTSGYILFLEIDLGKVWEMRGFGIPANYLVANSSSSSGGSSGGSSSGSDLGPQIENSTNFIIDNNNQNTNKIIEEQKKQTEEQKKTNDLLENTDTTEANNKGSEFFKNYNSNSHGLSGIITAPLKFLQSLTGAKCSPLKFQLPFVKQDVELKCMKSIYQEHFGAFYTLWQTITTGLIAYTVCLNFYKKIRDLQNPDNDKIEVLNL